MGERHGGDIYRNKISLDFSVNINPYGIPAVAREALKDAVEHCMEYPDPQAEALKHALSRYLVVPEETLLIGNGASELFLVLMHSLKPKKTVIPVPSFYGYEYAAGAFEQEICYYEMSEDSGFMPGEELFSVLTEDVDICMLANPNNPTGALLGREYLLKLLKHCEEKQIWLVLDECFIEFCPEGSSLLGAIRIFPHLIIIRAFTKSYSIPGVRLGYLVSGNPAVIEQTGRQLPEWNLSCFAQRAGCVLTDQKEWLLETVRNIKEERSFLSSGLRDMGLKVYPGQANFLFIYREEKESLYEILRKEGILIRDCGNFRGLGPGFYRIAVKTREENEILLKMIGELH